MHATVFVLTSEADRAAGHWPHALMRAFAEERAEAWGVLGALPETRFHDAWPKKHPSGAVSPTLSVWDMAEWPLDAPADALPSAVVWAGGHVASLGESGDHATDEDIRAALAARRDGYDCIVFDMHY